MQRDWMPVGSDLVEKVGGERAVDEKIRRMDWQDVDGGLTVAFMPGSAINTAIREFGIPKVSAVAVNESFDVPDADGGDGFYPGFYGIEGNYTNGRVRIYLLDTGVALTPVCADQMDAAS